MTAQGGNRTVLMARKMGGVTIADVMRDRGVDMRTAYLHLRSVAGAGKLVCSGGGKGGALRWYAPDANAPKPAKAKRARDEPAPLPPPSMIERAGAAQAARELRALVDSPELWGEQQTAHIDYSRPRRGEWITTWPALPGLSRINGKYAHTFLPGWRYTWPEVKAEMIPDLELLAEKGERPTEATS